MLQLQGGAYVENMVCLALLLAMNVIALAALTRYNAQISLMIWMTIVNSSAMHKTFKKFHEKEIFCKMLLFSRHFEKKIQKYSSKQLLMLFIDILVSKNPCLELKITRIAHLKANI